MLADLFFCFSHHFPYEKPFAFDNIFIFSSEGIDGFYFFPYYENN